MNGKQFLIVLIAMIFSSFLGGLFGQIITRNSVAFAESRKYYDEIMTKAIHLVGENEEVRASLYLGVHDSPQLILYDKEGTNRFNFGLSPAGNPGMSLNDENFNKLINLDTTDGRPSITVRNSANKTVWRAPN